MITHVQTAGSAPASDSTTLAVAYSGNVTAGNLLVVYAGTTDYQAFEVGDVAKTAGTATIGSWSLDTSGAQYEYSGGAYFNAAIFSTLVTGTGSCTITVTAASGLAAYWFMTVSEYAPGSDTWDASRLEDSADGQAASGAPTTGNMTSAGAALFTGGVVTALGTNSAITPSGPFTNTAFEEEDGTTYLTGNTAYGIVGTATTDAAEWSQPTTVGSRSAGAVYKVTATGGGTTIPMRIMHHHEMMLANN